MTALHEEHKILPNLTLEPIACAPAQLPVILDFNRKSSGHVGGVFKFFVGEILETS